MVFGALGKLARGLARTRDQLAEGWRALRGGRPLDESDIEALETSLLAADLGPALTGHVLAAVRQRVGGRGDTGAEELREVVQVALAEALPQVGAVTRAAEGPHVIFVVGVNGGGKTTTVGKLAAHERRLNRRVLVVAADTFRAAAVEQLERWVERAGAEIVKQREGADPAALVFDALRAAKARGVDTVIVDTAGRLQTKVHLMAELAKLHRVAGREVAGAPHEVLLVIDATTGQNGLSQAQEFTRAAQLSGVVLTKLDGTAKGGVALAIHRELGVPVRWVGVGEAVDDLLEFDRDAFIANLVGAEHPA
jgi:fused signal recognition particle receptor